MEKKEIREEACGSNKVRKEKGGTESGGTELEEFCPLWWDSLTEARALEDFFITVEFLGMTIPTYSNGLYSPTLFPLK